MQPQDRRRHGQHVADVVRNGDAARELRKGNAEASVSARMNQGDVMRHLYLVQIQPACWYMLSSVPGGWDRCAHGS